MAKKLKFFEAGRWQDKSYDPQFEVDAGEEVPITGSHHVIDGICESVTHDFAAMVEEAGRGEIITEKPVRTPQVRIKAEGSPAKVDKRKAEGVEAK